MKSLVIAMFLPVCLFGQFVNKGIDYYNFDYPDKVKSFVKTSVNSDIALDDTTYINTTVITARLDEKGEFTYYKTTENGDLIYEMNQTTRDNGRTVIRHFKGLNMTIDSIVTKLNEGGKPISTYTYPTEGTITVNNYQYDKNGNRIVHAVNLRDSVITKKYTYDKDNRVLSEIELRKPMKGGKELKFNEWTCAYNVSGQKTQEIHKYYSAAKTVVADTLTYTYNAKNSLTTKVYSNGIYARTNRYTYDVNGNLVQDDFSTTEEQDYDASMSEMWTFDNQGYWSSYTMKVDAEETRAVYSTVYNAEGLPTSCTVVELGTISKITWEYEYR